MESSRTLRKFKRETLERATAEKKIVDRERNIIILLNDWFQKCGFINTSATLQRTWARSSRLVAADNVDLELIIQDYLTYCEVSEKKPVLTREIDVVKPKKAKKSVNLRLRRLEAKKTQVFRQSKKKAVKSTEEPEDDSTGLSLGINGSSKAAAKSRRQKRMDYKPPSGLPDEVSGAPLVMAGRMASGPATASAAHSPNTEQEDDPTNNSSVHRLVRKLPYAPGSDMLGYATTISQEIFEGSPDVRWSDVIGAEDSKRLLKEAVVYPIKYASLFTGLLTPWKGVLLYGPPGTGKTMLAKAIATECQTTFFNISASSIVSKYRGSSEKLVRVLFELARYHAPSTVFLDEVDAILSQRKGAGEHEASRRMKTELLVQMDGLSKTEDLVFLLAASNLPWDLDFALLRRLEKRVLVGLPDAKAREAMIRSMLTPEMCAKVKYADMAARLEGFSGSDIRLLCREAAMWPLRRLMAKLDLVNLNQKGPEDEQALKMDPITSEDVDRAMASTRRSSNIKMDRYHDWAARYGST